jgi:hypothetical protein
MFFIIWRGWGILAPILALIVWLVPLGLIQSALGNANYSSHSGLFSCLFGILAAVAIWFVGRALNGVPGRVLVDPATGQQVILRKHNDLFFIPMQWWAVPVGAFAVVTLFTT